MARDYKNFMRILVSEEPGEPTLFEPFIHTRTAEQLLWRRGEHMWNTPEMYIDTLFHLNELTCSDVVVADTRLFGGELDIFYRTIVRYATDCIRFAVLCNNQEAADLADRCGGVCAVGVYGNVRSNKPMVMMDQTPDDAVRGDCAGWFAPNDAERYWDEYSDRIAILGGLGADCIAATGPVSIHKRCEKLYTQTDNRRFALGSGGCISDGHYLELISMLGIYKRYRY